MKNPKVLISKPAIAVYVALAVIVAAAFGFKETACNFAETFGFNVEVCNELPSDIQEAV